jgi:hypothetical protein
MYSFKKCLGISFIIVAIISIMVITVHFALMKPILWILFGIEAAFVLAFFLWFFNIIW